MRQPVRFGLGPVNAYLLQGQEGDVLVDTGLPGLAQRLLRLLRANRSAPERIVLIVLTHVHLDHVGNLGAVRSLTRAPVLVHRSEAQVLEAGRVIVPAGQTPIAKVLMGAATPFARLIRFTPCSPDLVVDDEFSLERFGLAGRVLHTPGHTCGSISVLLDSGDAVVGDLCQNGWGFGMGLGRIHLPLADAREEIAASWRRLIGHGARRLYPAHGRPFDIEALRDKLDP